MWKDDIVHELQTQNMFEDFSHLSRFKELLDCYYHESFFTPGLVKCMFLSCWDDEHFFEMLDVLNQLKLGSDFGLNDMKYNGERLAESVHDHLYDSYVFQLSCSFLQGIPFSLDTFPSNLEEEGVYIIRQALKASDCIDHIPFY